MNPGGVMTTPTPDVREIAAQALSNEIDDGFLSWNGCLALADAVLSAVTPVIRQQVAEEIAQAIHERFDHLHPEWHSNMIAVAEWCEDEARRRSHVQHRTEES
jgi:hypothetical protein